MSDSRLCRLALRATLTGDLEPLTLGNRPESDLVAQRIGI